MSLTEKLKKKTEKWVYLSVIKTCEFLILSAQLTWGLIGSYSLVSWLLFCFAIFSHTYDEQIVNGAQLSSIIMLLACQ